MTRLLPFLALLALLQNVAFAADPKSPGLGASSRVCTVAKDCNGHAISVRLNPDGTCTCTCANHWSGPNCSVCPTPFAGENCDRCLPGRILPLCTACTIAKDCSGHASSVTASADGKLCVCACANQWSGRNCSVCGPKFAGANCDRCAPGLVNYPACTVPAPVDQAKSLAACKTKCSAEGCSTAKLVGEMSSCVCGDCKQRQRNACVKKSTITNSPLELCVYPTNECMTVSGTPKCLNKQKLWVPCEFCP